MCLAQGHNTVMLVRLKPMASPSRVKHSTTEPLHSHNKGLKPISVLYTLKFFLVPLYLQHIMVWLRNFKAFKQHLPEYLSV